MRISRSEFDRFDKTPQHPALRYGQAWYNHFKLHAHHAADPAERNLLDRIYNERDADKARSLILVHFTSHTD